MLLGEHLTLRRRGILFQTIYGMESLLRFVEGAGLNIPNEFVPMTSARRDGYLGTYLGLVHARFATLIVGIPKGVREGLVELTGPKARVRNQGS